MTKGLLIAGVLVVGSALGVGAAFCPDDCCLLGKAMSNSAMAQEAKPGGCGQAQTAGSQDAKPGCTAGTKPSGGCCASKLAGQDAKGGCQGAGLASAEGGCPKSAMCKAALASMPKMTYRVGDQDMCCPMGAELTAKETGKPMQYVVSGEAFANQGDATVKLASVLDTYATELLSVQFSAGGECFKCPVSAEEAAKKASTVVKYRAAGVDFECKDKAVLAVEAARKAAEGVKLAVYVGEKQYACCVEAGNVAKAEGKEVVYVVGDQKTGCQVAGKLNLAQAKVNAIVDAAAQVALGAQASAAQATKGA